MKIENDFLIINFGEVDLDLAQAMVNKINEEKSRIFEFFGISKLSKKLQITLYDDFDVFVNMVNDSFERQAEWKKTRGIDAPAEKWNEYIVALGGGGEIKMLDMELCRTKSAHKNTNLNDFLEVTVHEFVHVCHDEIIKKSPLPNYLLEGIATQLSGQKYYQLDKIQCTAEEISGGFNNLKKSYHNAYTLMGYMLESLPHNELLEILSGEKEPDLNKLILDANKSFEKTENTKMSNY